MIGQRAGERILHYPEGPGHGSGSHLRKRINWFTNRFISDGPRSKEELRYENVARKLQYSRYRDFLGKENNSSVLKRKIAEELMKGSVEYDAMLLGKCFKYVEEFFGETPRKDGSGPYYNHVYTIAGWCLERGCDFDTALVALFHDCPEHAKRHGKTVEGVADEIEALAGKNVRNRVGILSRTEGEPYGDYLRRVYGSGDVQLMVVKAFDTVHNLSTLYYEGCPDGHKNSVVDKAARHAEIWRNINPYLFEVMKELIIDNSTQATEKWVKKLTEPTMHQRAHMRKGCVAIVDYRGETDLALLRSLPEAGTMLTLYFPLALQEIDYFEIEFPDSAGSAEYIGRKLRQYLPDMQFKEVDSKMPSGLVCSRIFRANIPPVEKHDGFFTKLGEMASANFAFLQNELAFLRNLDSF